MASMWMIYQRQIFQGRNLLLFLLEAFSILLFRYFHSTTSFIDKAVRSGGLVLVNCYMGWSRSATCVAAYLMMKQNMTATKVLLT